MRVYRAWSAWGSVGVLVASASIRVSHTVSTDSVAASLRSQRQRSRGQSYISAACSRCCAISGGLSIQGVLSVGRGRMFGQLGRAILFAHSSSISLRSSV
jgi:hypothetical protein